MIKRMFIFDVIFIIFICLLISSYNAQINPSVHFNHTIKMQTSEDIVIPPFEVWNKTYGGLGPDGLNSIQRTSMDNGFIMCGYSYSYSSGKEDIWIVKTDEQGNELWNTSFGNISHDKGLDIIETKDQQYLAIGQKYSPESQSYDCYLVKIDNNGNKKWEKTVGGNGSDTGTKIHTTNDDGFIFIMNSESQGKTDCYLIKIDENGQNEWEILTNEYLNSQLINGLSLWKTTSQDFFVTGQMQTDRNGLDAFLIKIDFSGEIKWVKTYGGMFTDYFRSIQPSNEGFILCGTTRSFGKGSYDVWLLQTDKSGNEIWNTTFGAQCFEEGFSVRTLQDQGFIITGYTSSFGVDLTDLWIIQTNERGIERWNKTYGGVSSDKGLSIVSLENNEYVILGNLDGNGWLLKFQFFDNTLKTSFLIGSIQQSDRYSDNLTIIHVKQMISIQFLPLTYTKYTSNQSLILFDEYSGIKTDQYIFGFFQVSNV